MDNSKCNANDGPYPWHKPNWSNQIYLTNLSKNNGSDDHAWNTPNRSSQTRNSCLGSFQVNDIPTNNDRKSWEHTNGSNQDWRNSTKKYFKVKPKQIPPCGFCKNNEEDPQCYNNHSLNDKYDRVNCPRLYSYVCPLCKATGYNAHTVYYCPFNTRKC